MLWFYCDDVTGAITTGGIAPTEDMARAQGSHAPEGHSLYIVPDGTVGNMFTAEPDFTALRSLLCARIDSEAGASRSRFITDVPGQAQTYERKEREARTWSEGNDAAQPELYPFMIAEAEVRGVPVAQVRAEIMAQVDALTPLAASIEAHRMAAKTAVSAAQTLPAIILAAQVDWAAAIGLTPA